MKKKAISLSIILLITVISSLFIFTGLSSEEDNTRGFGLIPTTNKNTKSGVPMAAYVKTKSILGSKWDWSEFMPIPKDQGKQNSCVGWAVGYAYKSFQELWNNELAEYSEEWICSPAYLYNSLNGGKDEGVTLTRALTELKYEGCLPISIMPYNVSDWSTSPPKGYDRQKEKFKISDYVSLINGVRATKEEIEEIKEAVYEEPIVIGSMVSLKPSWENFFDFKAGDYVIDKEEALQISESYSNGNGASHAMVIVGYDNKKYGGAFKVMNSWGDQWGDGGFFWVSYAAAQLTFLEAYRMIDETEEFIEENISGTIIIEPDSREEKEYILPIKLNLYSKIGSDGEYKKYPKKYDSETRFFSIDNVFKKGRDKFQVSVQSSDNYCLYFINITPSGRVVPLFPKGKNDSARIYKNKEYRFPSADGTWEFGGDTGRDLFVIIVSEDELERSEYSPRRKAKDYQTKTVPIMTSQVFKKLDGRDDVRIYALELFSEK